MLVCWCVLVWWPDRSFGDCIRLARVRFEETFRNSILQLLDQYPLDLCVVSACV